MLTITAGRSQQDIGLLKFIPVSWRSWLQEWRTPIEQIRNTSKTLQYFRGRSCYDAEPRRCLVNLTEQTTRLTYLERPTVQWSGVLETAPLFMSQVPLIADLHKNAFWLDDIESIYV